MYGEMGMRKWGDFISQTREGPRRPDFSGGLFATNTVPEKIEAVNIHFWAWSNFNSFANLFR